MYQLFILIYAFGVWVAALFSKKVSKMRRGEHEAFDILRTKVTPDAKYIWFHAASLGEFEQGRPLIEEIRRQYPEYRILLTFFSPSGYEVRKNYPGADICCYLPLDTKGNAHRFLSLVQPVMAFFIKYEFWYNYLHILHDRGVPTYSVSSIFRPDQIFFKWYGREYKKVLNCFTHFFVQNHESQALLAQLGITAVTVTGDTRFDRVLQIKADSKRLRLVEAFVGDQHRRVFVAGSSWAPDEDIFIPYFNERSDWKMIIAPHVIGEDHLEQILSKVKGRAVRYTQASPEEAADADCMIIDCFGLLSSIYHYGDVSYVGGGFGVGIHNVLEAAVWGIPVIFGPNNDHFREAQGLLKSGGGFQIDDASMFSSLMKHLSEDEAYLQEAGKAASEYVNGQAGATAKILREVNL